MQGRLLVLGTLVITASLHAQTSQRRAAIVNGGGPDFGRCSVEVTVDKSAEIEIRGDNATLRNTGGQSPQFRRFECTSPLPSNPQNFRFAPAEGRGKESLVRDPRNGGVATVDIQDDAGGAGSYAFELTWGVDPRDQRFDEGRRPDGDRGRFEDGDRDRGFGPPPPPPPPPHRFTETQAVTVCQDAIRSQAMDRFRTRNIDFQKIGINDNRGGRDWVDGELVVRKSFGRRDIYKFSCSVNLDSGGLRSARIDQFERSIYGDSVR